MSNCRRAPVWHRHAARAAADRLPQLCRRHRRLVRGHARRPDTRLRARRKCRSCRCSAAAAARTPGCIADGPVSAVSLLAPADPMRLEPATTELPSRVAENLFWLGRYVERAEHIVRLLRSFVSRLADQDTTDDPRPGRRPCCRCSSASGCCPRSSARNVACASSRRTRATCIARQSPHAGLRTALNEVAPARGAGARSPVDRHVADPQPAASGHARCATGASSSTRCCASQSHDHGPRGLQRHGDGEHDARPRLALPGPRPAAGALAESRRRAAARSDRRGTGERHGRSGSWIRCSRSPTAR